MLICLGVPTSHAEKRLALMIGNDRYANLPADQQLRKAVNDARSVGDALGSLCAIEIGPTARHSPGVFARWASEIARQLRDRHGKMPMPNG